MIAVSRCSSAALLRRRATPSSSSRCPPRRRLVAAVLSAQERRTNSVVVAATAGRCSGGRRFKSVVTTAALADAASATTTAAAAAAASKDATSSSAAGGVPVAASLAAAGAAIAAVAGAAAVVENATAVPEFDPVGQRYDQSNFAGRFSKMLLACDPRLLLYTREQVERSKRMVDDYAEYKRKARRSAAQDDGTADRALWEARRIVESAVHPDTGDWIPRPFRMSGYVPFNGPVCVAMVASQSTPALLFWSWANQSQNALVNYYNRNASSTMTNETLAKSYAAAVGSALIVAFGLATAIQKRFPADKARQLLKWVAFPSAVVASSLNCYIVRSPEIESGIPLLDPQGNDVLPGETSQVAAARGVRSTTLSRAILQAPVYFLPPVLLSAVGPLRTYLSKAPSARTVPATTFLLLVSFGIGLPATVAIFPQMSEIEADQVEPKFQHLRRPGTNQPYQVYRYNKGL